MLTLADPTPSRDAERRRRQNREAKRRQRARAKAAKTSAVAAEPSLAFDAWPDDPAAVVDKWARETLRVPTGPLRGQPFELAPWQVEWLRGAWAPGVFEAGCSVARKGGKSGMIAVALLACLAGPLNFPQWRGVVTSLTGQLAKELRDAIELTAATANPPLPITVKKSPAPGWITGKNGARVDILAADKATGHAIGADLAIIDEGGLLGPDRQDLWDAMVSCTAGRAGRLWVISIRGHGPMFAGMAKRADDPGVHWVEYRAPDECALDDPAAWAAANPSLDRGVPSRESIAAWARRATRDPTAERNFRSHHLNQPGHPDAEMIVDPAVWAAVATEPQPERIGPCYLGFDLGESSSMTCGAAFWPESGLLQAWGGFPDTPSLADRAAADRTARGEPRYADMLARGEIALWPGRVTPVLPFIRWIADKLAGEEIAGVTADSYREEALREAVEAVAPEWPIEIRRVGRGAHGFGDVRRFQTAVLDGSLRPGVNMMLETAIANAEIRRDNNQNPYIEKSRQRGRIDALSAAVLAVGTGAREHATGPSTMFIV